MIIPWLRGFQKWRQAPLTWALVLANVFVFFMTYEPARVSKSFTTSREVVLTGRLYHQYLAEDFQVKTTPELLLLGSRALRDPQFLREASTFKFSGDAVAIEHWQKSLASFSAKFREKKAHSFGLLSEERRPLTWITYQFMHAGWMHLLSNMLLLLIFGAALEAKVGSEKLVGIFLLSGVAGGLGFLWLGGHSMAPMVGASGSLSGVMAAYAIVETRRRVGFFYFLSPIEGYYGVIYLPTLVIFPLCFVTDLASYLATPSELGAGVAYAAHLGGVTFGVLVGLLLRLLIPFVMRIWRRRKSVQGA